MDSAVGSYSILNKSKNHLDASRLLDSVNFTEYSKKLPDSIQDLAVGSYSILNKSRLRTELCVV
jgi:hypothetical protein